MLAIKFIFNFVYNVFCLFFFSKQRHDRVLGISNNCTKNTTIKFHTFHTSSD